jgi:hypothetical protein
MSLTRLSPAVQTLYAELLELSLHGAAEQAAAGALDGALVSKEIRGRRYWYLQRTVAGSNRQHYLGPESAALQGWMDRIRELRLRSRPDVERRAELCAMLAAGGATRESAAVTSTLALLADGGLFARGGVLVGTVAFAVQATMLGVRFGAQMLRTEDVDAAHDPDLAVALGDGAPRSDLARSRAESPLGFLPVPELDPRHPSTSFKVRGRQLRVDFLTPARGRNRMAPVLLRELGVAAQPLPFLDYLMTGAVQAVAIGPTAVLVNVPDPSRTALHKLWTAAERPVAMATKATKDVAQASALLSVLVEDRPGDLELAWKALSAHPSRRAKVQAMLSRLPEDLRGRLPSAATAV